MPSGSGVKIYIGNLPDRARSEDIKNCFSKYGTVVNMELKGNYGFIEYEERRMCDEAISHLHGTEFQGSQLRVEFAHTERNGSYNNKFREGKSSDTCFKCGQVGHWARECSSNARELVSRKPGGRYEDRRTTDSYVREPYNGRENRDKYDRDERYPPPLPIERGGYERPYDRYGREPPELEYRRDYQNYDRNYYPPPREGYERDGYDRRPLPPDVAPYAARGRTGSPPPRRGSYDRGIREAPPPPTYRGRSPPPPSRYPEQIIGPHSMRPISPRTGGIYRRRSMSPMRNNRAPVSYSGRQRSPSPIGRTGPPRRGPRTPSPPRR
ncbi:14305_t:CDS:2 [Acaulospora morrowiae]|uniref:14305_t:CDS:1 n=1 Tax=Acaulospora morrowiae TaxID=94023 RepID=A0A9N9F2U3_9GLOM|nr:14305_t:CDS:2 [Acaulospora morrowiae]